MRRARSTLRPFVVRDSEHGIGLICDNLSNVFAQSSVEKLGRARPKLSRLRRLFSSRLDSTDDEAGPFIQYCRDGPYAQRCFRSF
eukprot:3979027-Pleurochrysis_carterae.AAC.2